VAQAIIRPTGAGMLELMAEADGMPQATITIKAR
jgi:hypothetical protein